MDALMLKSYEFRRERESAWRELAALLARAEKLGVEKLSPGELSRLPVLYRATLSSLSVARAISLDRNVVDYLESLAARAYFCVYGTKRRFWSVAVEFFAERFPTLVRRYAAHIGIAALFMALGMLAGFALTSQDPEYFYSFVGEDSAQGRDPTSSTADLRKVLYRQKDDADAMATFASFLFSHNARIGIFAFALGFVAGIPVYILLLLNGLILGAFSALYHSRGLGLDWWGWVLPHGVTELLAVVLCGGAGLVLAQSVIFPGRWTRLQNLAAKGREAGVIVLGAVALFFIAALIEGIFRQTVQSIFVRYLVIVGTTTGWLLYFIYAGRRSA